MAKTSFELGINPYFKFDMHLICSSQASLILVGLGVLLCFGAKGLELLPRHPCNPNAFDSMDSTRL